MSEWDGYINENTYHIFINNTLHNKNKIIIKRGLSVDIVPTLDKIYNFVYIDGDHSAKAVWLDAIYSFEKLVPQGIMIFDDYNWNTREKSPKNAIDKFIEVYKNYIEILEIKNQVIIKKLSEFIP